MPALTQRDYDALLWACDLNLVRGEDSWVRALLAGQDRREAIHALQPVMTPAELLAEDIRSPEWLLIRELLVLDRTGDRQVVIVAAQGPPAGGERAAYDHTLRQREFSRPLGEGQRRNTEFGGAAN